MDCMLNNSVEMRWSSGRNLATKPEGDGFEPDPGHCFEASTGKLFNP